MSIPKWNGTNCGCTDGLGHSPECKAEHDALYGKGKSDTPRTDAALGRLSSMSNTWRCECGTDNDGLSCESCLSYRPNARDCKHRMIKHPCDGYECKDCDAATLDACDCLIIERERTAERIKELEAQLADAKKAVLAKVRELRITDYSPEAFIKLVEWLEAQPTTSSLPCVGCTFGRVDLDKLAEYVAGLLKSQGFPDLGIQIAMDVRNYGKESK
jgi:hypothetical protein